MNCFSIGICLVICLISTNKCEASVVEIYVAIDPKVINDYINHGSSASGAEADAMEDAEYFLTEVNSIIQSTGTDIGIHVRQMDVLAEDVFNDCQLRDGDSIHEDLGLQTFQRYLKAQGLFNSIGYDMALLWTGYNIYGKTDATAGYATVGAMCNENAVAMVEYDGTYRTVHVAAHEIGHVLGLNHDEDDCDNGYIMTETLSYSTQRWSFSPCSIQILTQLIPGIACITSTNSESYVPDETPRDALLDVHEVCQRARNWTDSYMCMSSNLYDGSEPQGDIVCERIFCGDSDGYCYRAHTTNGLICGVGQRCSDGQCATAPDDFPTPAGLEEDCLFGDVYVLSLGGGVVTTCSEFFAPADQRSQCYSPSLEKACCESCGALRGDIPGCAYGDRSTQCVDYPQSAVCPAYKDTLCCEYCNGWSSKRSSDDNQTAPVLNTTKMDEVPSDKKQKDDEGTVSNTAE